MSWRESDAAYEWLLSDHPDARAERDRRRAATYVDTSMRAAKVLTWVAKVNATPGAPETLRDLAATMWPLAVESTQRASADHAVPDADYVAQARADWENVRRADDPGYRYPARYLGEAATSQPRPDAEPEAGS